MEKEKKRVPRRILITLEEYQRLKDCEENLKKLQGFKTQCGTDTECEQQAYDAGMLDGLGYLDNDLQDRQPGPIISDRQIPQVEKFPSQTIVNDAENLIEKRVNPPVSTPAEIFCNVVREKYRHLAFLLLKELIKHNSTYSHDSFGVITYKGNVLENATLFDFLPITFYSLKKKPANLDQWLNILKEFNLTRFIKNKALLRVKKDETIVPPVQKPDFKDDKAVVVAKNENPLYDNDQEELTAISPEKKWYQI